MKIVVGADELMTVVAPDEPPPKRGAKSDARMPLAVPLPGTALEVAVQTSDNSIDLRGLRTDDALSLATSFLDRSLNAGRKVAFLVHGHGTGALRDAIRRELRESKYVKTFRPGESGEGG